MIYKPGDQFEVIKTGGFRLSVRQGDKATLIGVNSIGELILTVHTRSGPVRQFAKPGWVRAVDSVNRVSFQRHFQPLQLGALS